MIYLIHLVFINFPQLNPDIIRVQTLIFYSSAALFMHGAELKDWVQRSMVEYAASRDLDLREGVAAACQPLVWWVVYNQFQFVPADLKEDAFAEGNVGLASAINGYNGTGQFSTYAVVCIYRRILSYLRKEHEAVKTISLNRPVFDDIELGNTLSFSQDSVYPSDISSISDKVYSAMRSHLNDRERRILELRYGLRSQALTLAEIGRRFKLSRERIRQIEAKALKKLRESGLEVLLE